MLFYHILIFPYKGNTFSPIMKALHGKTRNSGTFTRKPGNLLTITTKRLL